MWACVVLGIGLFALLVLALASLVCVRLLRKAIEEGTMGLNWKEVPSKREQTGKAFELGETWQAGSICSVASWVVERESDGFRVKVVRVPKDLDLEREFVPETDMEVQSLGFFSVKPGSSEEEVERAEKEAKALAVNIYRTAFDMVFGKEPDLEETQ